jgi:flagellar basal-body rod protein FlgG
MGYRGSRSNFQEMLDKAKLEGVHLTSTQLNTVQGSVVQTGNQLDVAIEGDGFFPINIGGGKTGYTRDGQFMLDAQGRLVTASGNPLIWTGTIPAGAEEIAFQPDGLVRVRVGDNWVEAGTINLARFANPSGLQLNGNNILVETVASGTAQTGQPGTAQYGRLLSGSVENANMNFADEITHLMSLQRGFQMSTRIFQATDTMISQAIHVRKV